MRQKQMVAKKAYSNCVWIYIPASNQPQNVKLNNILKALPLYNLFIHSLFYFFFVCVCMLFCSNLKQFYDDTAHINNKICIQYCVLHCGVQCAMCMHCLSKKRKWSFVFAWFLFCVFLWWCFCKHGVCLDFFSYYISLHNFSAQNCS